MNSNFKGGVVNCRGSHSYQIEGIGVVTFTTDKNLSIYKVNPRDITIGDTDHDILSVVRGQVPDAGAISLQNAVDRWITDASRWS